MIIDNYANFKAELCFALRMRFLVYSGENGPTGKVWGHWERILPRVGLSFRKSHMMIYEVRDA
jgi:hypothetical protein